MAPLPIPLLLLWDIDGTLLQRASTEHAVALKRAIAEVHGVSVTELDALELDAAGRTDRAIARSLLSGLGVGDAKVDARADEVLAVAAEHYDLLCPDDLSHTVVPGVPIVLERLAGRSETFRHSLVTGNVERVARRKLGAAGVGGWFAAGQGGFGSDAEAREALPPIARARAAQASADGAATEWPRERTVVIGDTPRDIVCARADGLRVIGVTTGPHAAGALSEADAVARDAEALAGLLEAWGA